MSIVSNSAFAAAIAAVAHLNTLRAYRAILWKFNSADNSWERVAQHHSVPFLRSITVPACAYILSEEFVDVHGNLYDSAGGVLDGGVPVKGMLREAHPHVKWTNPDMPDPFPWIPVSEIQGSKCVASAGMPAGWISRLITVSLPGEADDDDSSSDGGDTNTDPGHDSEGEEEDDQAEEENQEEEEEDAEGGNQEEGEDSSDDEDDQESVMDTDGM